MASAPTQPDIGSLASGSLGGGGDGDRPPRRGQGDKPLSSGLGPGDKRKNPPAGQSREKTREGILRTQPWHVNVNVSREERDRVDRRALLRILRQLYERRAEGIGLPPAYEAVLGSAAFDDGEVDMVPYFDRDSGHIDTSAYSNYLPMLLASVLPGAIEPDEACKQCYRSPRPFDRCLRYRLEDGSLLHNGACINCLYGYGPTHCSFTPPEAAKDPPSSSRQRPAVGPSSQRQTSASAPFLSLATSLRAAGGREDSPPTDPLDPLRELADGVGALRLEEGGRVSLPITSLQLLLLNVQRFGRPNLRAGTIAPSPSLVPHRPFASGGLAQTIEGSPSQRRSSFPRGTIAAAEDFSRSTPRPRRSASPQTGESRRISERPRRSESREASTDSLRRSGHSG
ncbi:MAG: hypothetical protein M1820_008913 [Bogoriella megaspora]|nr:MAG: hypothetical protein M1820_008913 [Bogoriella megaspora]